MEWLLFEDNKPQGGQLVALTTDRGVGCGKYDSLYDTFNHVVVPGNTQYSQYQVTHWMPLPEPPAKAGA